MDTLVGYFKTKGRVLKAQEYSLEMDTPIRIQQIRNIYGSWNTMEKLIMARLRSNRPAITDVNDVIAARNRADEEQRLEVQKAGEDQEEKASSQLQKDYDAELAAIAAINPPSFKEEVIEEKVEEVVITKETKGSTKKS